MVEEELEPLITQCPNCQTRFRVTETQLQIARGSVRCGSCLTVFPGIDHLLWEATDSFATEKDAQEALDQLLDELSPDDESDASRNPATAGTGAGIFARGEAASAPPADAVPLFDVEEVDVAEFDFEGAGLNEKSQLYSGHEVADAVDDAALAPRPAEASPQAVARLLEQESTSGALTSESAARSLELDSTLESLDAAVPLAAGSASDSPDALELEPAMPLPAADPVPEPPQATGIRSGASTITGVYSTFDDDFGLPEPVPGATDEPAQEVAEFEVAAGALEVAAVEPSDTAAFTDLPESISFAPEPRRWWTPLIILAGLSALVVQIFWLQFEDWSRDPAIRPIYTTACDWLGCRLPLLRDLKKMFTRNLVVRSHPDLSGALIVDAIIVNQAEFTQPFPVLELRFTSIGGNLVAGRRFQPAEYLSGELLGGTQMAPLTPIRIELQIEDPGSEAVNYFLDFR